MKKAFVQLHVAVFLAGFTGILGRLIRLNEGLLVWYRLFITAITMWGLYGMMRKLQRLPITDIIKISGVGFIAAMHWVTFYGVVKYANVSVALVCFSCIGFFTAMFEPFLLKKKINRVELLLGLITMAGIYIIFRFDNRYKAGIILGVISALLAAIFPIFNREYLKRTNVETLLVWQQTGGLLVLSVLLPFYIQLFPTTVFLPGTEDLIWLLLLSWLCSVLAFHLSASALKHLSAFTVNLTYNLEPVYGILLAFAVFNENKYLGHGFFMGFAIIAFAIIAHIILLVKEEKRLTHGAN
jgi:drug/metabolite transporter (DMT)-like permease